MGRGQTQVILRKCARQYSLGLLCAFSHEFTACNRPPVPCNIPHQSRFLVRQNSHGTNKYSKRTTKPQVAKSNSHYSRFYMIRIGARAHHKRRPSCPRTASFNCSRSSGTGDTDIHWEFWSRSEPPRWVPTQSLWRLRYPFFLSLSRFNKTFYSFFEGIHIIKIKSLNSACYLLHTGF
jgi:hypothetical protein